LAFNVCFEDVHKRYALALVGMPWKYFAGILDNINSCCSCHPGTLRS